jgi:hypothetical protein
MEEKYMKTRWKKWKEGIDKKNVKEQGERLNGWREKLYKEYKTERYDAWKQVDRERERKI